MRVDVGVKSTSGASVVKHRNGERLEIDLVILIEEFIDPFSSARAIDR